MPIEYTLLKDQPCKIKTCPNCGKPFEPFLRGQVQRPRRWLGFLGPKRDYCALICAECMEIVGHESPPPDALHLLRTDLSHRRELSSNL